MNLLPLILFGAFITFHLCDGYSVRFAENYEENQRSIVKRGTKEKKAKAPKAFGPKDKKRSLKELWDKYMNKGSIKAVRVQSIKGKIIAETIVGKREIFAHLMKRMVGKKSCALPKGGSIVKISTEGLEQVEFEIAEKDKEIASLKEQINTLEQAGLMVWTENEERKLAIQYNELTIAAQQQTILDNDQERKELNAELRAQAKKVIAANKVTEKQIQERQKSSERHVAVVGQKDREITDLKTEKSALAKNVEDLTKKSDKLAEDLRVTMAAKAEVDKWIEDLRIERARKMGEEKADKQEIQRLMQAEARLLEVQRQIENDRRNLQEELKTQGEEVKRLMNQITNLTAENATEKAHKEKNQETINNLDRELQALKVWQASTEQQIKNLNQREKDLLAQMNDKDTQHEKEKGNLKAAHAEAKTGLEGQLQLAAQSNNSLTSRIEVLNTDAKHLTGQLTGLQAAKEFLDSRVKVLESEKGSLELKGAANEAALKKETEAVKVELANIVKEKAVIEVQKAEHQKDIANLQKEITKQEKDYQTIVNQLKVDVTKAQGETATETKLKEHLAQQIADKENQLKDLQFKVDKAESENSRLSLEIGELKERANNLARDLAVGNERHANEEKALINKHNAELRAEAEKVIAANKVSEQQIQKRQKSSERHVAVVDQKDREITDLKVETSALAKNVENLTKKSDELAEKLSVVTAAKDEVDKHVQDLKTERARQDAAGNADKQEIQRLMQSEARLLEVQRQIENDRRNLQEELKTQGEEVKRLMDTITSISAEKATEKAHKEKNQETINILDRELQALKVWQASTEVQIKNLNQREKDLLAQMNANDIQHEKEKGDLKAAHAETKAGLEGQLKLSEQSNSTLTSRIEALNTDAKHLTGQLTGLQAAKEFLDSRVKVLESEKGSLELKGVANEAALKKEIEASKMELANIVKEKAVIEEQKAAHLKDITQLHADIAKQEKDYQATVNQLKSDVSKAHGHAATETKLKENLAQQIVEKENKLSALQAKVDKAENENSRLSNEISELRERANNLARDLALGNERHAHVEKALTKEVADLTTEKKLLAQSFEALKEGKETITARLAYVETRERELNGTVADLKADNAGLKADAKHAAAIQGETVTELKLKEQENARFHEQLSALQAEHAAQTVAIAALNVEIGREKEQKGTAEGINIANKDRILDLLNNMEVLRSQQTKHLERIEELEGHVTSLNIENGKLKNDVEDLMSRGKKLEEDNQAMEDDFTRRAQELIVKIANRDGTIERLREEYEKSFQQADEKHRREIADQLNTLTNHHMERLKLSAADQEKVFNLKLQIQKGKQEKEYGQKVKAMKEAELKEWQEVKQKLEGAFKDKGSWCTNPLPKAWFTVARAALPSIPGSQYLPSLSSLNPLAGKSHPEEHVEEPVEKIEPKEMADAIMGILNNFIDKKKMGLMTPAFRTLVLTITPKKCAGQNQA